MSSMSKKQTIQSIVVGFVSGILLTIGGYNTINYYKTTSENTQSQETTSKKDTLIVLSPHFDDAVLTVGDLIAEYTGTKYIVTFCSTPEILPSSTSTKPYLTHWDELSGFEKSIDSRNARIQENETAAKIIGAKTINLRYVDGQYETRTPTDNSALVQSMVKDVEDIIKLIQASHNSRIMIIGPSYFGPDHTHQDHFLVSKTLVQVAKDNFDNQLINCFFNEDNPYTSKKFGVEEITLDNILTDFYEEIRLKKREIIISEKSFNLKLQAIRAYTSQVLAFHNLGDNILEITTKYEMNRIPQNPLPQKPFVVLYEIKEIKSPRK